MLKVCSQCSEKKKPREFFKDVRNLSGLHSECKTCTKEAKNVWARKNLTKIREYARNYHVENRERCLLKMRRYRKTPEYRSWYKEHRKGSRDKINARKILRYHVSTGKIRPKPCRVCKSPKVEAHHPDYSRPLFVVWLCRKHHALRHRKSEVS